MTGSEVYTGEHVCGSYMRRELYVAAHCSVMVLVSRSNDHWSETRTLIFRTCCKTRAEIALYRAQ